MIIAVLKETLHYENRVAASPETVKRFIDMGFNIIIEKDAGLKSGFYDDSFINAGATIETSAVKACKSADIILKVSAPDKNEIKNFNKGAIVICNFSQQSQDIKKLMRDKKLTCFALEKIPRISRAQNMDILSSQDNLTGYKAVLNAVNCTNIAVPMMTTAAGTNAPAKIFIWGVGVSGLQAIATAKRLGALVYASDIRKETKEETESLGANFVEPGKVNATLPKMNIIITAAGVSGYAPVLLKSDILKTLAPNTVVYDTVGNVEGLGSKETIIQNNITIIGNHHLASEIPMSSSRLYANNILNFVSLLYDKDSKSIKIDIQDEIIKNTCILCSEII